MQIILTNPNTKKKWRISSLDNGRCFSVQKSTDSVNQNGIKAKRAWAPVECYPSNITSALEQCVRLMMLDPKDQTVFSASESMSVSAQIAELCKKIEDFIEGIEVQCK